MQNNSNLFRYMKYCNRVTGVNLPISECSQRDADTSRRGNEDDLTATIFGILSIVPYKILPEK